jgi:hypothetical protein
VSGEIDVNDPSDPGDWEESPDHPSTLPQNVTPERPEGAVEPPHVPVVVAEDDDAGEADTRDGRRAPDGRFQPRHRAASQRATPDDVATINDLTRRIKAAEEADGADIARNEGESDRVYTLRRRAEVLERRRAAAQAAPESRAVHTTAPAAPVAPAASRAAAPVASADDPEPNPEDAAAYPDGQYDRKFIGDLSRWHARQEHRALRDQDAKTASEQAVLRTFATRVDAAKTKYADFDAIAFAPTAAQIPEGSATDIFIMEDEAGAEVLYHLRKNPAELRDILGKPVLAQLKALALLSQRLMSPPARAQAVTTGSAAMPPVAAVPRSPNPVRTSPVSVNTGSPSDDDSLEAHEAHYYGRNRR